MMRIQIIGGGIVGLSIARSLLIKGYKNVEVLEKESEISEDEKRDSEGKIQIITDEFINEIDDMLAQKEKDIKSV